MILSLPLSGRWKESLATQRNETRRLKAMAKWQTTLMRTAAQKGVLLQEEQLVVPPELKSPVDREDVALAEIDRLTALLREKETEAADLKASWGEVKQENLRLKAVSRWQSATMRAAVAQGQLLREENVVVPQELKTPTEESKPTQQIDVAVAQPPVIESRPASASRLPGIARRLSTTTAEVTASSSSRPSSPRPDGRPASPRPASPSVTGRPASASKAPSSSSSPRSLGQQAPSLVPAPPRRQFSIHQVRTGFILWCNSL